MTVSAEARGERVAEQDFRPAMRHVAAPVSVVTTQAGGRPHGATVSAFDSLSMDPPLLSVTLKTSSRLLAAIGPGARLGVNVLTAAQASTAVRFAGPAPDRFAGIAWRLVDGAPQLRRVHAWIALDVSSLVPVGDHVLVIGDVVAARAGVGRPLTHHAGGFGTHAPGPATLAAV